MSHPMEGKTLEERIAWQFDLIDGRREGTVYDVGWLLDRLGVVEKNFRYYLNKECPCCGGSDSTGHRL